MCGLFGYSGKDPVDVLRLSWLAVENQSRGDDSTGVYGNFLSKSVLEARKFILTNEFYNAVSESKTIIGHTRKATMGGKTERNAHPFEVGEGKGEAAKLVVGTHNGVLFQQSFDDLAKKYDIEKPDVDSEFIYMLLVHNNFDYDKTLSELEGMIALGFIRPEFPDTLYLYRRDSRPLHVGFLDGVNMYYSSEMTPLDFIGCQAIESLKGDNLYTFKNGGLVEVSPVKKSLIRVTTLDMGITAFLAQASQADKDVLGIPSATAKTNTSAGHKHGSQKYNRHMRTITTDETQGGESEIFHNGQLSLLPQVPGEIYTAPQTKRIGSPRVGRYYTSGHNDSCYVFIQLVATHDAKLRLPAWIVSVKEDRTINAVSTHNGIAVLEIPAKLINSPINIEIFNPMQQTVVYETTLNKVQRGRVLEVALSIPFPSEEETQKTSTPATIGFPFDSNGVFRAKGQNGAVVAFSRFLESCKSGGKVSEVVSVVGPEANEERTFIWRRAEVVQDDSNSGHTQQSSGSGRRTPVADGLRKSLLARLGGNSGLEVLPVATTDYNKHTDILYDMDAYNVATNIDELEFHLSKTNELLSDVSFDEEAAKEELNKSRAYFEYLLEYFKSRSDSNALDEEVDATNQYKVVE